MIYKFSTFQEASQFSASFCVANKCSARVQRDGDQWNVETDEPTPDVSKTSAVPKVRKIVVPWDKQVLEEVVAVNSPRVGAVKNSPVQTSRKIAVQRPTGESKKERVVNTHHVEREETLISKELVNVKPQNPSAERVTVAENWPEGHLSNKFLLVTLERAKVEERLALSKILDNNATKAFHPKSLQRMICEVSGNKLANFFLRDDNGISYGELLVDACQSIKAEKRLSYFGAMENGLVPRDLDKETSSSGSKLPHEKRIAFMSEYIDRNESALLSKLLVEVYGKMSLEQQAKLNKEIQAISGINGKMGVDGLAGSAALLVLGNLGGFATYTALSSALSMISFGSLGFGAYTMASSLLSVALGPMGWIGLGLYGAVKLGAPDKQKVVQLAATCAMIRQRLKVSR